MEIETERLDRFELFRDCLTEEERAELDQLVFYVVQVMQRRGCRFGPRMAKELIMALIDFKDGQPGGKYAHKNTEV